MAYAQAERRHAQTLAATIDHDDRKAREQALLKGRAGQAREREPRSR